ncbi:50S ribosomal protein L30 [Spirosoma utsteinense]|jgi:large subunit ribosomal protein L30|uniref:Large ribosomal subunit protein uL30 n=1 Tax=Spirosoma utsteinense TaxID=2585773 RepID=A0ABR6W1L6_9BACT|nr:50S ribosomal protein L30 [Spirosoma utsteinense]MBC3785039.1 large subunit ribosomal protein L30 [Spirosoma utsteinense]MBC3790352.1 large subunit ribosomal protein L30 [Spirosoma utsteinense]
MARVRITQVRSTIDRPQTQKNAIKSLGLGKINRSVELEYNDSLKGALTKVQHLVKVEEI